MSITLTPEQIRAGRAILRMTAKELGEKAGISLPTVQRLETRKGSLGTAEHGTIEKLVSAFRESGIDFPDQFSVSYRRMVEQARA
ncbi:helix-turn-helix transcriptional regulator (plasmid) [Skermanella sp. TT6]|uniref:Helix-turn-helix transcriptional regulator n=1 Tax=Skermanella cutis TaxID=2775420 RepID=A0ABX7BM51_9PROT|nr:helix-turn-helix transcriptional regulator [Skermanella sp. TT6]QQP94052.1 helix-turn-helix transcriptional regulator [Skermanella sp. TT6]